MKLKRVRTLAPGTLKGRVPGELYESLAAYAGSYREVHGKATDLWPLLLQMLRALVDADRGFHTWRRPASEGRGEAPAWPGDGTGTESQNG
jgi:hypothetical protein